MKARSEFDSYLSCLPPVLKSAVIECARVCGAPVDLATVCGLGAVSASIGKGIAVESGEGRTTTGNLFLVAGSPSGVGKSVVFRRMLEPFLGFERELSSWWSKKARPKAVVGKVVFAQLSAASKCAIRQGILTPAAGGERLLECQRAVEQFDTLRLAPRLMVDDATVQALLGTLSRSGEALLWSSPDARHLLRRMSKSDSAEEAVLLKAFSGDPISVDRVTRDPVEISSPTLSCLMLSQPKAVASFRAKAKASESGLLGRFLFANVRSEDGSQSRSTPKRSDDAAAAYGECIRALIERFRFGEGVKVVSPTQGAVTAMRKYGDRYNELASSSHCESEREVYARRGEQAWRLSLVVHAARHGDYADKKRLDGISAKSAVEILERLFPVK